MAHDTSLLTPARGARAPLFLCDAGQRTIEQEREKPTREDGRDWTHAMERAAQLRAQGQDWEAVAEATSRTEKTVQQYPSKYPPFDELVDWYRTKIFSEEVERLIQELQPELLKALQEVVDNRDIAGTDIGPAWSDLIRAAAELATITGMKERQKLRAREEVQGTTAEKHSHTVGSEDAADEKIDRLLGTLADDD